jgi:hypothetical protein
MIQDITPMTAPVQTMFLPTTISEKNKFFNEGDKIICGQI